MAGGEDQPQQVVVDVVRERLVEVRRDACPGLQRPADLGILLLQLAVAPEEVDRPALGDRHQPGAGIARNALGGPLLERGDDRVLGQVLGQADVAGVVGQARDQPGGFQPDDGLDRRLSPAIPPRESDHITRRSAGQARPPQVSGRSARDRSGEFSQVGIQYPEQREEWASRRAGPPTGAAAVPRPGPSWTVDLPDRRLAIAHDGQEPLGPLDGLVLVPALHQRPAADQFLGLGERAVQDGVLAVG